MSDLQHIVDSEVYRSDNPGVMLTFRYRRGGRLHLLRLTKTRGCVFPSAKGARSALKRTAPNAVDVAVHELGWPPGVLKLVEETRAEALAQGLCVYGHEPYGGVPPDKCPCQEAWK